MSRRMNIVNKPWKLLGEILRTPDTAKLRRFLQRLSPAETARVVSRLSPQRQRELLTVLEPEDAAGVIEGFSDTQAVDLIEDLPVRHAAAIVDEIQSDRQADLLGELDKEDAEAILKAMTPEEADDVRQLLAYDPDTAGGLMIKEYVVYKEKDPLHHVLQDLEANRETYKDYHVQYVYVQYVNYKKIIRLKK